MKEKAQYLLVFANTLIGIGIFILYIHHVRNVFHTKTNYNYLTKLEKESIFRKENALYLSFYKIIVEADNFWEGYNQLLNLTTIEHPNSANIFSRFHILPEVFIGFLFHHFKHLRKNLGISCLATSKSDINNFNHITQCEGYEDPYYLYVEIVWFFGGLTVFLLYSYSSLISKNNFGGIYAVVLYIIFHKNASKIYETPAARENFAFPFIFWQMFYISLYMEGIEKNKSRNVLERVLSIIKITILTTISLLCWQFASIIYMIQILLIIILGGLGNLSNWFCIDYSIAQLLSTFAAFFITYGNKKFFISWQNGPAITLLFVSIQLYLKTRLKLDTLSFTLKNVICTLLLSFSLQFLIVDILQKSGYIRPNDNPFYLYGDLFINWSLQAKTNFTTNLLACNPEFGEYDFDDMIELLKTLFIKPYCLFNVVLLAKFLRKWRFSEIIEKNPADIERIKKYVLEDFIEEKKIKMDDITNKETENDLTYCFKLLEECNYNYEKYKIAKRNLKKNDSNDLENFMNDIKKLKNEINENEKQSLKTKEEQNQERSTLKEEIRVKNNAPNTCKKTLKEKKLELTTSKLNFIENCSSSYLYSAMQLLCYLIIGLPIRKLFFLCFTQGCVIAPTLCSKFWYRKESNIFWAISFVVFITSIISPGYQNLQNEYIQTKDNSNYLENMLEWIQYNTDKNAVFGGPIDVISNVYLTTGRPIINHPHVEMRQISERTEIAYSVYSRQQSSDIYNHFTQIKLEYLIVDLNECHKISRNICDILTFWDELQPEYRKNHQFCAELLNRNVPSFLKVFSNKHYVIIKMFSQSIQINLKYKKLPEKGI